MITSGMETLQNFIADNRLKKPDGTTAFDAIINFYNNDMLQTLISEVQVIAIPLEMAVYIVEFFNDDYPLPEMYATSNYDFKYAEGKPLKIFTAHSQNEHLISIEPLR